MITKEVIDQIYRQFSSKPKNIDHLDLALLFERAGIEHDIMVDPDTKELTVGSIPDDSPFHTIPLGNVHAFVPFEEWVAIVMHSSIVFLNTLKPISSIHLKANKESLFNRLFHRG